MIFPRLNTRHALLLYQNNDIDPLQCARSIRKAFWPCSDLIQADKFRSGYLHALGIAILTRGYYVKKVHKCLSTTFYYTKMEHSTLTLTVLLVVFAIVYAVYKATRLTVLDNILGPVSKSFLLGVSVSSCPWNRLISLIGNLGELMQNQAGAVSPFFVIVIQVLISIV